MSVNYANTAGNANTTDGQHLGTGNSPTFQNLSLNGVVPTIQGYSPSNYALRMTPNFHLNAYNGYAVILNWDQGTTGATQTLRIGNGANADAFYVRANGVVWSGNTITAASDARLKTNIQSLTGNTLKKIDNLRGVYFNWKPETNKGSGRQIGVIAQEVEKIYPELVTTDEDGYKSVAYDRLGPILIEAIKEQQKEIDSLKSEVDSLKKDIEAIKQTLKTNEQ